MSWADSQAVLNDGFMAVYGGDATIVATGEVITAAFDQPHTDGEQFGVPANSPQPQLLVYDTDAVKLANGSEISIRDAASDADVVYTVVDAQPNHDGLTRITLRNYNRGG